MRKRIRLGRFGFLVEFYLYHSGWNEFRLTFYDKKKCVSKTIIEIERFHHSSGWEYRWKVGRFSKRFA